MSDNPRNLGRLSFDFNRSEELIGVLDSGYTGGDAWRTTAANCSDLFLQYALSFGYSALGILLQKGGAFGTGQPHDRWNRNLFIH